MESNVHISANLLKLATFERNFLKNINDNKLLRNEIVIRRAIWRHEKYWLPRVAELDMTLVPPQDIY